MNEYMKEFYKEELETNYSKGKADETVNSIRKMMKNLKLSAEVAMEALEIPKTDFPKYMGML